MDTLIYSLLAFSAFGGVFLLGWQVGCWFVAPDIRPPAPKRKKSSKK